MNNEIFFNLFRMSMTSVFWIIVSGTMAFLLLWINKKINSGDTFLKIKSSESECCEDKVVLLDIKYVDTTKIVLLKNGNKKLMIAFSEKHGINILSRDEDKCVVKKEVIQDEVNVEIEPRVVGYKNI